jgi:hypothetical protein
MTTKTFELNINGLYLKQKPDLFVNILKSISTGIGKEELFERSKYLINETVKHMNKYKVLNKNFIDSSLKHDVLINLRVLYFVIFRCAISVYSAFTFPLIEEKYDDNEEFFPVPKGCFPFTSIYDGKEYLSMVL